MTIVQRKSHVPPNSDAINAQGLIRRCQIRRKNKRTGSMHKAARWWLLDHGEIWKQVENNDNTRGKFHATLCTVHKYVQVKHTYWLGVTEGRSHLHEHRY